MVYIINISIILLCSVILYLVLKRKINNSINPQALIEEIRVEVDRIILQLNNTTERNITFMLVNTTGVVNETTLGVGNRSFNFTYLIDGVYYYNVTVEDSANNRNYTETRTVTLDTVYPTIDYVFPTPENNTNQSSSTLIINVTHIEISPTLHAVRFQTTHFTPFYLIGGGVGAILGGGGGGGGGCSISVTGEGDIFEFALPYIVLAIVMIIIRLRDSRYRKRNTAAGNF